MINLNLDYIRDYINENIELKTDRIREDLCAHFEVSFSHFEHSFRADFNFPFGIFIRRLRLEKSREYLKLGRWWEAVSYMVGYTSPIGFRLAFEKEYGISPIDYAHKYSTNHEDPVTEVKPLSSQDNSRESCKGYIHLRAMTGFRCKACHLFIDTGHLRNCPAAECSHYNNDSEELKRILMEARNPMPPIIDIYY